jgi:hypothetical protein
MNIEELEAKEEIVLEVEELEDKVAPGISVNHNETIVEDGRDAEDSVLNIEELELKIAPGRGINHNETLVSDIAG